MAFNINGRVKKIRSFPETLFGSTGRIIRNTSGNYGEGVADKE